MKSASKLDGRERSLGPHQNASDLKSASSAGLTTRYRATLADTRTLLGLFEPAHVRAPRSAHAPTGDEPHAARPRERTCALSPGGTCATRQAASAACPDHRSYFSSSRWIDVSLEASGGRGACRLPSGMCSGQRITKPRFASGSGTTMPSPARTRQRHTPQYPSHWLDFATQSV